MAYEEMTIEELRKEAHRLLDLLPLRPNALLAGHEGIDGADRETLIRIIKLFPTIKDLPEMLDRIERHLNYYGE